MMPLKRNQAERIGMCYTVQKDMYKFKLNKIAARWPAKAVAQFFTFSKKGSDRIVPR